MVCKYRTITFQQINALGVLYVLLWDIYTITGIYVKASLFMASSRVYFYFTLAGSLYTLFMDGAIVY